MSLGDKKRKLAKKKKIKACSLDSMIRVRINEKTYIYVKQKSKVREAKRFYKKYLKHGKRLIR